MTEGNENLENTGVIDEELDANLDTQEVDDEQEDKAAAPEGEGDQPEDDGEEKPAKKNGMVPHSALHQERMRRQTLEREVASMRQQYETFNQRLDDMRKAAAEADNAPPDADVDPIGALKYTQAQLKQQQDAFARQEREAQERQQYDNAIRQIDNAYQASWSNADEGQKAVYAAYIGALDRHFMARGVVDAAQRQKLIHDEERAVAYSALQQGRDPASVIVEAYGEMAPATPQEKAATAQDIVERRAKAAPAARSLSNAGGKSGDEAITAERIANMSMDEYESWRAKATPAQLRKFLGG